MATLLALVFPAAMVAAALSDIARMTIPNRLQVVLASAFVPAALAAGLSFETIGFHALTAAFALSVTFGCFAAGWMGGGDAKLIAGAALWLGPTPHLVQFVLVGTALGGVLTLLVLAARAALAPTTGVAFLDRLLTRTVGVPYGVALGIAGLVAFAASPWAGGLVG